MVQGAVSSEESPVPAVSPSGGGSRFQCLRDKKRGFLSARSRVGDCV